MGILELFLIISVVVMWLLGGISGHGPGYVGPGPYWGGGGVVTVIVVIFAILLLTHRI